jgi:uncharacterized protein involved in response to NO
VQERAERPSPPAARAATGSPRGGFVLFRYGFRPFFLLAGLWAVVPMLALFGSLVAGGWPAGALPLYRWHAHELIFGYAAAAIAGFLLTAVPSWTGARPVSGAALVALVALWAADRVIVSPLIAVPVAAALPLGVAFFPALAGALAVPLLRAGALRNMPFLLFLSLLFAADLLLHARYHGLIDAVPFDALRLALNVVLLLVVIVGGRIIPAFSHNALRQAGRPAQTAAPPWLNGLAIGTVAAILMVDLVAQDSALSGVLAALGALLLLGRLSHWQGHRTLDMPLVWVLHLGYGWLVVGLMLKAVWLLLASHWAVNWLHALNVGAFGTMILGVMTRAALGHTGRALVPARIIALAYVLVSIAALARVWGPLAVPVYARQITLCALGIWVAAYAIYLFVYFPILLRPRLDGKPG